MNFHLWTVFIMQNVLSFNLIVLSSRQNARSHIQKFCQGASQRMRSPLLLYFLCPLFVRKLISKYYDTQKLLKIIQKYLLARKKCLEYGIKSIRYAGAKCWISISHVIKQASALMSFKLQI